MTITVINPADGQPLPARLIDGALYLPCGPPSLIAPIEIVYDPAYCLETRDALAAEQRLKALGYRVEMKEERR